MVVKLEGGTDDDVSALLDEVVEDESVTELRKMKRLCVILFLGFVFNTFFQFYKDDIEVLLRVSQSGLFHKLWQ